MHSCGQKPKQILDIERKYRKESVPFILVQNHGLPWHREYCLLLCLLDLHENRCGSRLHRDKGLERCACKGSQPCGDTNKSHFYIRKEWCGYMSHKWSPNYFQSFFISNQLDYVICSLFPSKHHGGNNDDLALRVCTAPSGPELGLQPSYWVAHTVYDSDTRGSNTLFWPRRAPSLMCIHTSPHMQLQIKP